MDLLEKASIILTPTAYNNGEALCVKPSDGSGDFDFSRNSAATRVNAQGLVENVQILSSNLVQNGDFSEEGVQEVSNGSFSQEGSEEITNGDFENGSTGWALNGWTISNGKANCNGITANLIQSNVGSANKTFKLVFTISNYISGKVIPSFVGLSNESLEYNANGTYTTYISSLTDLRFVFYGNLFNGSIDNVSVREVGQDWTLGTGWSIAEDKASSDGSQTSNSSLFQSNVLTQNKYYKFEFTLSNVTSGAVRLRNGIGDYETYISYQNSNGTYTAYSIVNSSNKTLVVDADSSFIGSITNISVKEVGQNWVLSGVDFSLGSVFFNSDTDNIFQNGSYFSSGTKYKLTFEGSGNLAYRTGFAGADGTRKQITLPHTAYLTATADTNRIQAYGANGNLEGTLTNISLIEITDDTNLPRINYEGFSYQDALGSEEIVNGSFDSDTAWDLGTGWTISGGSANCDGVGFPYIRQNNVLVSGKTYLLTFDITSYTSGSIKYEDSVETPIFYNALGSYSQTFTADSNNCRFQSAAFNGSIDNVSVKEYLGQEVVPDSGCGSWLFEPQSTNLITQSELFSDSSWAKIGTSVTSGFSSPSGNLTAFKLVENSANSIHQINVGTPANGDDYSFSVFVKKGEREFVSLVFSDLIRYLSQYTFDLTNGVITKSYSRSGVTSTFTSIYMGNGWYKLTLSSNYLSWGTNVFPRLFIENTATPPTVPSNTYQGDGTSGLYIWGAMLEQNSFSTSYIPTSGATVTRNQDVCTNGGSLASINSTSGTLYAEIAALAKINPSGNITLTDGTGNNRIYIYYLIDNSISVIYNVNSTGASINNFSLANITDQTKIAVRWGNSNVSVWINGASVLSNTTSNFLPNTLNVLSFAKPAGGVPFEGKTKAVAVWKEALSDSELQSLTTI